MKGLSSTLKVTLSFLLELFDANDFELDNSEEKISKLNHLQIKLIYINN